MCIRVGSDAGRHFLSAQDPERRKEDLPVLLTNVESRQERVPAKNVSRYLHRLLQKLHRPQ